MDTVGRPARRSEGDSRDAALLRLVRVGEPVAIYQLYQRLGRPAFALASRLLADEGRAEDVVQQVFLSIWRDPGVVSPDGGTVAAGVLSLVHQRAVEAIRDGGARRRPPGGPAEDPDPPRIGLSQRLAAGPMPGAVVEQVRLALAMLPATQREALLLAFHGGYTQREVAALARAPIGVVKTRMLAGMRRLQQEVADDADWIAGHARGGAATADGPGR